MSTLSSRVLNTALHREAHLIEIPDQLRCLFSAQEQNGSYLIEVPKQKLQLGTLRKNQTYRVAVLSGTSDSTAEQTDPAQDTEHDCDVPEPPVTESETRDVEIKDLGKQGDGIARAERGYVVIVPNAEQGDHVTIEITEVRKNVAFAEVVNYGKC